MANKLKRIKRTRIVLPIVQDDAMVLQRLQSKSLHIEALSNQNAFKK
ncbi:hypothetical protein WAF17_10860 [Bernardetia sp. ABR2-2B]